MRALLERLFGTKPTTRDYLRGPTLAGLDPIAQRAVALQKAYWRADPAELATLEQLAEPSFAERLRLHHLRCMAWLSESAALQQALLAPASERGPTDALEVPASVIASLDALLVRRSPHRARHGFAWLGSGPPAGEGIPYSDHQGRTINASFTHLGALEVITLDASLEPAALAFVPFDELVTLTLAPREAGELTPFRAAKLLREYGLPEQVVLVPLRHGLSWYAFEPALLRGEGPDAEHELARVPVPKLGEGRSLALRVGWQRLETLSDYEHEGLGSFRLADAYQLSLAIDADDPRFADKCRGRGIEPEQVRGDVVRESRLRASARARKTTL